MDAGWPLAKQTYTFLLFPTKVLTISLSTPAGIYFGINNI